MVGAPNWDPSYILLRLPIVDPALSFKSENLLLKHRDFFIFPLNELLVGKYVHLQIVLCLLAHNQLFLELVHAGVMAEQEILSGLLA